MLEIACGALRVRLKPPRTNKATEHQHVGLQWRQLPTLFALQIVPERKIEKRGELDNTQIRMHILILPNSILFPLQCHPPREEKRKLHSWRRLPQRTMMFSALMKNEGSGCAAYVLGVHPNVQLFPSSSSEKQILCNPEIARSSSSTALAPK